jgi:hypothetical protein
MLGARFVLLPGEPCGRAAFIPLLEKDKAVPLEFIRFPIHLWASIRSFRADGARGWDRDYRRYRKCFRRTARRVGRVIGLSASLCAWGPTVLHEALALLGG